MSVGDDAAVIQFLAQLLRTHADIIGTALAVAFYAYRTYRRLQQMDRRVEHHAREIAQIKQSLPPAPARSSAPPSP